jgi:MarR family transcriptional repressor of emrRAB
VGELTDQIVAIEAGLNNLQKRVDAVPVTEILISRLLINLGREISNHLDQRLRPFGLSEPEFKVLVSIHASPDGVANPGELCAHINQSPANITRLTDSLVERELISRIPDEQDRRRLVLQMTPQGTTLIKKQIPLMMDGARKNFRSFSRTDLKRLLADLKQLAESIDRDSESVSSRKSAHD